MFYVVTWPVTTLVNGERILCFMLGWEHTGNWRHQRMMRKHLKDQTGERLCPTLTTLENERESRLGSSPPSRGSKARTLPSPTPPGWAFVGRCCCIIDIKPWLLSNPVINHQNQNGALLFQESHQSKLPTYKRSKEQRPKTAWFAKNIKTFVCASWSATGEFLSTNDCF